MEEVKHITDDCKKRVQDEQLPTCIAKQILDQLSAVFPDISSKRFAVRSSCAGEDSEDMSAAGQMDTFLGVKGENEVTRDHLCSTIFWIKYILHRFVFNGTVVLPQDQYGTGLKLFVVFFPGVPIN